MALFVAVDVPEAVRAEIRTALSPVRAVAPDLRYTNAASWHLTLAFLGRVDQSVVPAVSAGLALTAAAHAPFAVALDGSAGTFGRSVLWAGFAPAPALAELAAAVRSAVRPAAGESMDDKPFSAHLTLARAPRRGRVPHKAVAAYAGPQRSWQVDALHLLSSDRRVAGGGYEEVGRWPLAGTPGGSQSAGQEPGEEPGG